MFHRVLYAQRFPIISYCREAFFFRLKHIPYIASEICSPQLSKITFDGLFTFSNSTILVDDNICSDRLLVEIFRRVLAQCYAKNAEAVVYDDVNPHVAMGVEDGELLRPGLVDGSQFRL